MKQEAYAATGVDIDLGNKVKATLPQWLAATHRREVLGRVGGRISGLTLIDSNLLTIGCWCKNKPEIK